LNEFNIAHTKIHPESEQLFEFAQQRVTKFKLNKDIAELNFYAYPSLESFPIASFFVIHNFVLFILDDHLEKFPNDLPKWIQYLKKKEFSRNGYLEKWFQLYVIVAREVMNEAVLDELIGLVIFSITVIPKVVAIHSGKTFLAVNDYFDLRIIDSGVSHNFFFFRIDCKLKITDELKSDPDWIGLEKQAAHHLIVINDLYSFKREVNHNIYRMNYIYIKMMNDDIGAQEAVNKIIQELREFEKMTHIYGENLKKRNNPMLTQYVEGVYAAMYGNHYWSTVCKRYNEL